MPYLRRGQFRLLEERPVAGRRRQLGQRPWSEAVILESGIVLDLIERPVAAGDQVANLRDVLAAVCGQRDDLAVFRCWGVLGVFLRGADDHRVGGGVIADIEADCLADIADFGVVAAVDGVCLDLDAFAVHCDLLTRLLRREHRARRGGGDGRAEDDAAGDERDLFLSSGVLHDPVLLSHIAKPFCSVLDAAFLFLSNECV